MSNFDFDLFVIGAGSGGVRAARMAAGLGAKVAIAEERYLGGTCVNVGCVPKKLFVYGSHFAESFEQAQGFGWSVGETSFDWPTLRDNKSKEIERLNGIYGNMLVNSGCTLIDARATLKDAHTVLAGGKEYTAERIIVAVGGWPFVPEFEGSEHVISSNEVFYLEEFPKDVLVVGGGYIAVEFAGIFEGLGANTRLAYRGDLFLRGFDQEIREFVAQEVSKKGVKLDFGCDVASIQKQDSGRLLVTYKSGESFEVDQVMYATGRVPKVANLGLEELGIEQGKNGAIVVNDDFQTSVPSVYAIGDVIDRVQLTPVALAEGMALVKNLYGNQNLKVDYNLIATAVFCQPNVGTVGLSEEQAKEAYDEIAVYTSDFRAMKHTLSGSQERTFMKLIVDTQTDKVLGIHMVGDEAGEIIQGLAVALKAGATKATFDATIGIHPTAAEEFVTMREPTRIVKKDS